MQIHPIANHATLPDIPSSVIDDHTEFLDLGGTRAMSGDLSIVRTGTNDAAIQFDGDGGSTGKIIYESDQDRFDFENAKLLTTGIVNFGAITSSGGISALSGAIIGDTIQALGVGSFGGGVEVNTASTLNTGITLLGHTIGGTRHGALITWWKDASDVGGYNFCNTNNDFVWSDAFQNANADQGKAFVNFATGAAGFAAGNFTISDAGAITAPSINVTDEAVAYQISGGMFLSNIDSSGGTTNINLGIGAGDKDFGTSNIFIGKEAGLRNDISTGRGTLNVYIGGEAGRGGAAGNKSTQSVGIGFGALRALTTGTTDLAVGYLAGLSLTIGSDNTLFGALTGADMIGASGNVYLGSRVGKENVSGGNSVCVGFSSGEGVAGNSFSNNTFLGYKTGFRITTGSGDLFLGNLAGTHQTDAGDIFLLDNQDRGSAAAELTDSLIYGTFNATAADQILRFNANVIIGGTTPVSLFEVDGAMGLAIQTVTANTTLDKTHSTLLVNASGNVIITLPTAASAYNSTDGIGRIYRIKKIDLDADTVTLDGNGSETIDGGLTAVLTVQFETITVQSDGSNWHIL